LPSWLPNRRWFAGKDAAIEQVNLAYGVRFGDAQHPVLLSEIEVTSGGQTSRYQLPFGFIAEDQVGGAAAAMALSAGRRGRQVGLITDAFSLETLSTVPACRHGMPPPIATDGASPRASALSVGRAVEQFGGDRQQPGAEADPQSRLGVHPELEMSAYLTEAGFENISPLLGSVIRRDAQGEDIC
jgi:maltose alpha-D-glucosyltransferase/alpha-amylase